MKSHNGINVNDFDIVKLDCDLVCLVISSNMKSNNLLVAKIFEQPPVEFKELYDISHMFNTKMYLVLDKLFTADISRVEEYLGAVEEVESAQLLLYILSKIQLMEG